MFNKVLPHGTQPPAPLAHCPRTHRRRVGGRLKRFSRYKEISANYCYSAVYRDILRARLLIITSNALDSYDSAVTCKRFFREKRAFKLKITPYHRHRPPTRCADAHLGEVCALPYRPLRQHLPPHACTFYTTHAVPHTLPRSARTPATAHNAKPISGYVVVPA